MYLRKLASTKEILYGYQNESLQNENKEHEFLVKQNQHSNYTFPSLSSTPIYSGKNEISKDFNFPKSIQWCHDGSSFVTSSEDNGIRLYITSPTLLEDDDVQLNPFLRSFRPTPIICSDLHPRSSIYDGFCSNLISSKDVPLKLISLIPDDEGNYQILQSFQIRNYQTEEFLKIHSTKFINDSCFIAGSNKLISIFDVNRPDPILQFPSKAGITSCIAPSKSEFLTQGGFYTGTFSNKLQLYDGNAKLIQQASVQSGNGIIQTLESSNGKYLYVISRNSSTIDVLDIRMGLELVSQLHGFSSGNQRINGDVLPDSQGLVIGTNDGRVLWYKDAELGIECSPDVNQLTNNAVSSITVNPKEPSVLAIGCGDRSSEKAQVCLQQLITK